MTVTPAAANFGASSLLVEPPAENSAMSRPDGSAVAASSTRTSTPSHGSVVPADRGRGEEADLVDRERPLGQHPPHHGADLAGGTDDADLHRPVPP